MANSIVSAGNYPKKHNNREKKLIETARQYESPTAANFDSTPATLEAGLEEVASKQQLIASGTIANAALKTLNATPVSVIAAPGAGKLIIVDEIQIMYDYATAAFDGVHADDELEFQYATSDTVVASFESVGLFDQVVDEYRFAKVSAYDLNATSGNGFVMDGADNEAVEVTVANSELYAAAGGGALHYKIKYHIVDLDISA